MRERQFKRVAFASTLGGLVVMAVGLQRLLTAGDWLGFLLLFLLGGALALLSVVIELVPEPGFVVTLYTREGCTLCEEAQAYLAGKKSEYDFDLWLIDVDRDEEARERYSDWVPVARVGDEEIFRLSIDYPRVEAKLRALADKRLRK